MIRKYLLDVLISSKIILDQDYFCIEVFLERKSAEIRSESEFINERVLWWGARFERREKMITRKGEDFFRGRGLHISFEFAQRRG